MVAGLPARRDGDMDILVMNMNEPPSLIRADVKSGHHWLKVKLMGTDSNRTAIAVFVFAFGLFEK